VRDNIAPLPGFEDIEILDTTDNMRRPPGARLYTMDDFEFGVDDVDMVLTFRNVHNFDEAGRMLMHRQSFEALKSGGIYGIVDHTRRHMEPDNSENRRRIDPVLVIKEAQAAGFEFVDYSTLHYRADDELEYEVGRRSVTGNTDRFTFKFRKP
jgi:predicted methyltransferase